MKALYVWLPDKLNKQLTKHCKKKVKKAHIVRAALDKYLGELNERKNNGMETHVSTSPIGKQ